MGYMLDIEGKHVNEVDISWALREEDFGPGLTFQRKHKNAELLSKINMGELDARNIDKLEIKFIF